MTVSEESKIDSRALREAAANSAKNAHAPYSHFHVGAAALTTSGLVVLGCNVENASYGLTLCAECGLVSDLVLLQAGKITELVVCSERGEDITPCGRCRQLLMEHSNADSVLHTTAGPVPIAVLLPDAFSAESLH
jgi:cytidine deaminase